MRPGGDAVTGLERPLTRQELIDALGAEFMLRTHPRREWLIEQIMVLVDAYVATQVAAAADAYAAEMRGKP